MGTFSIWHWLVVLVIVLLFFGAGRLPNVMGDLAKGIKNFKAGMKEGEADKESEEIRAIPADPDRTVAAQASPARDEARS